MSSYNSYDGVPVSSSYHIMTEILRNEWEYPYFVITDAGGSGNLITLHKVAATREEAAKLTLEKGLSVEMGGGGYVFETLAESVASGYVNEDFIDVVVGTVLRFDLLPPRRFVVSPSSTDCHIRLRQPEPSSTWASLSVSRSDPPTASSRADSVVHFNFQTPTRLRTGRATIVPRRLQTSSEFWLPFLTAGFALMIGSCVPP